MPRNLKGELEKAKAEGTWKAPVLSNWRVLSLWQPWASLMAWGEKAIETRDYDTSWRGPVVIHAAKTVSYGFADKPNEAFDDAMVRNGFKMWPTANWEQRRAILDDLLPHGQAVAVGVITETFQVRAVEKTFAGHKVIDCMFREHSLSTKEKAFGGYDLERYGWKFAHVVALPEPIPHKGMQWMPRPPVTLIDAIREQLPEWVRDHGTDPAGSVLSPTLAAQSALSATASETGRVLR